MKIKTDITRTEFFKMKEEFEKSMGYTLPLCSIVRLDGLEYRIGKTKYFLPYLDKTEKQILREQRINKLRKLSGKKEINFEPVYKIYFG